MIRHDCPEYRRQFPFQTSILFKLSTLLQIAENILAGTFFTDRAKQPQKLQTLEPAKI